MRTTVHLTRTRIESNTDGLSRRGYQMERPTDEALYVMGVLQQMRDRVTANPDLFLPDALATINREIARYEGLMQEHEAA